MERVLRSPLLRLVPVALCFCGLQSAVFAEYRAFDVVIQGMLALAAGVGAGAGAERGAFAGFIIGLVYDLSFAVPIGSTSLAYGLAAMVAGYVLVITPDPQWWLATIFVTLAAVVGYTASVAVKVMLGETGWVTTDLITQTAVVAVAAGLLSPVLVPLGRWSMGVRRKAWKAMLE